MIYLLIPTLILLAIVQLTATNSSFEKFRQDCNEMSKLSDCHCTHTLDFEVYCTTNDTGPYFRATIRYNEFVQIDCHIVDPQNFNPLPNMTIGSISTVQIHPCSPVLFIQDILNRLGIIQVKVLIIEKSKFGDSLRRIYFKGLQNIEELSLISSGLTTLLEDTFAELQNLKELNFRSNRLELTQNIFGPLVNLKFIELGDNNLKDLPPGIFHNQKALNHLNLWSNKLTNLSKESFKGASTLTELDLSGNNIADLRPDVFDLLPNLGNLNLDGNHFKSLPVGLFSANRKLVKFRLTNNRVPLKQLPPSLFADLPNLREIRLSCELQIIPENTFARSNTIRTIAIAGNNLTELPNKLFQDQTQLYDLDLSQNQLVTLPDEIFLNTVNLASLQLSYNRLQNISRVLFRTMPNLVILYLNNNNIINIESNAFSSNRELQILSLKNNYIQKMFAEHSMPKLRILDLSYNKISTIVSDDLQFHSRLININLIHNNIHMIDFKPIQLKTQMIRVAIGNNPIRCDCKLLAFVQFLRKTDRIPSEGSFKISTNNLQCATPPGLEDRLVTTLLPYELLCPQNDEPSSMKQCPIGCLCSVRSFDHTLIVNCSNGEFTKIPTLPVEITTLWNRTELYVQNNKLFDLSLATEKGYSTLNEINAANNSLTTISVDNLPRNIAFLDVSHNKLQRLNTSLLEALNKRHIRVALSHNPWICDCASKDLLQFVQANYKLIPDQKDMQCESGEKFAELSSTDLCTVHGLVIGIGSLIFVISICFGITAALYYKYQQGIKVWLYAHSLCLWFVTEDELDKDKKYDAFISYSHQDEDFIMNHLVPEFEKGPTPFQLCIHIKDWVVGDYIPDQIVRSVCESRRTIIVLSPNFIESVWARMEFRTAHNVAFNEGRSRVIVVIYGDIGNIDILDPELKAYLKMNTYVEWGDPWFWDKIRYAMPHLPNN